MEDIVLYPQEAHYLRKNKTVALPRRFLFLATEAQADEELLTQCRVFRFQRGWTRYMRRNGKDGEYREKESSAWDDSKILCEYISFWALKRSPLYVICANPVMDVGASGVIPYFTEMEWELDFYYSGGRTFILVLHQEDRRIKFLSYHNFLSCGVEACPVMTSLPGELGPESEVEGAGEFELVSRTCEAMSRGMLSYLSFIREHDLGGFAPSVSGQSMRAYRHRFMRTKLLIYHALNVNGMEREAYFGGRTECYRIGEQPKADYVQVDVNGMYPSVMKNYKYPVKLVNPRHGVTREAMRELVLEFAVVAKCWISTDEPIYPYRTKDGVIFPVGKFVTTLCTDSVYRAVEYGHLLLADPVWCWEGADIFSDYVNFFYDLRLRYQEEGDEVMALVAKLFLNSLYGKFGERRDVEIDTSLHDGNEFFRQGYWNEVTGESGFEEILFHKWRICEGKCEAPQSFPAIAAHVTDYARNYLWWLMEKVGRENVFYVDTDSMIFERKYLPRLENAMDDSKLGYLKVIRESDHLVLHGPKDYEFGDAVKRKGIRSDAPESPVGVFTQHQYPSFIGLLRDRCYDRVPVRQVRKELHRRYDKGSVDVDGGVTPWELTEF